MVTGGEGKHLVEKFIEHVVSYMSETYNRFIVYVEQYDTWKCHFYCFGVGSLLYCSYNTQRTCIIIIVIQYNIILRFRQFTILFKLCFEYYHNCLVLLPLLQVAYYIEATGADNHAVREAACACIAELGSKVHVGREGVLFNFLKKMNKFKILLELYKVRRMLSFQMFEQLVVKPLSETISGLLINKNDNDFVPLQIDRDVVRPFIPQLLEALLICFNDDSWPVRDGMFT